jgi:predicted transcriptional regulator of viral defense system
MEFKRLLELVSDEPVFESNFLFAGDVDPQYVQRQLARWAGRGYLHQLRRGLYALAPPYTKTRAHPFLIANRMVHGSYVSCQSALAYYGLIPEYVPTVVSVTTGRPGHWDTPLGSYEYRHIKPDLFYGYTLVELSDHQRAFVAQPEKAILDLVHLTPSGDTLLYLQELRLQNLDRLDLHQLANFADRAGLPKWQRAAQTVHTLADQEAEEFEVLV